MMDDEKLMAFADGTLDDAEAEAVADAIDKDPAIARRFARLQDMHSLLRTAFDAPMQEPPPAHMVEAIHRATPQADVVDFAARRAAKQTHTQTQTPPRAAWTGWAAMAASLVVGLFAGHMLPQQPGSGLQNAGLVYASEQFGDALDGARSRTAAVLDTGTVTPALSFTRSNGDFCREFAYRGEGASARGIACKQKSTWTVVALVPASVPSAQKGYQTASGDDDRALEAIMLQLGASDALDADAEARAIRSGWKNRE